MRFRIEGREIVFPGTKGRGTEQRCQLLSAFVCPKCSGILKAYFLTPEPVRVLDSSTEDTTGIGDYQSLVVPGGQALISTTHDGYVAECLLEIFWAPSLKHNLRDWLTKQQPDRRFGSLAKAMASVRAGKVAGLVTIPDLVGNEACLLGSDEDAWVGPWNHRSEDYDTYWERKEREEQQRLSQLGVVSE